MLMGIARSALTLLTASIAVPSEALGARLNERVMTGNWPWWLIVIGTEVVCSCVNALSGTSPPFGKAVVDAVCPDCRGDAGAVADVPPAVVALEAIGVLEGPNEEVV